MEENSDLVINSSASPFSLGYSKKVKFSFDRSK